MDTRFDVIVRPTVQTLGLRRTSFVRRRANVPNAVNELHRTLVGLLEAVLPRRSTDQLASRPSAR